MEVGHVVAIVDLIVGVLVVIFGSMAYRNMKGGVLAWAPLFLTVTGVVYVIHAATEVFMHNEGLYAVTGLVATLALGFTVIIFGITLKLLGVRS